jgi:hypothetical protein
MSHDTMVANPKPTLPRAARLGAWLDGLGARPARAVLLMAAIALIGNALVCLGRGWPVPGVHDEFSYLLAADTFAHGRMTNPSPPLWQHFETVHELLQPTYQSRYPMGQGLVLALGQTLGHPAIGLWIEGAMLSGGLCWMLLAWLPRPLAMGVSLLATLVFGVLTYWTQSYWGGALAGFGGALLYGGLRRLLGHWRTRDAFWVGLSLVTLALTRPYEGACAALPAAALLLLHLWRRGEPGWRTRLRVAAVIGAVLAAGAGLQAYYNFRVTGHPLDMPYNVYAQQYEVTRVFWFRAPAPAPAFHDQRMQEYHLHWQVREAGLDHGRVAFPAMFQEQFLRRMLLVGGIYFYCCPLLAFWVLDWSALWRDRWLRVALAAVVCTLAADLLATCYRPHYSAPALAPLLVLEAAAAAAIWPAQGRWRRLLTRTVVIEVVALFVLCCGAGFVYDTVLMGRDAQTAWPQARPRIAARVLHDNPRNLIIVRYGLQYEIQHEWVYNAADLDAAPIIWARELGPGSDADLLRRYADRKPWLLILDRTDGAPILRPYPCPGGSGPAHPG